MKRVTMFLLLIMLFPSLAFGGEIYGSITEGKRSVGAGVRVEIITASKTYPTETDRYGSYRLYVPEKGACTLKVHYRQPSQPIKVYSYEGSVRYDLVLEKRDGHYSLRME
ncbi:MAG TPA: hypothetical protein ENN18_02575 [Proteobacteria bacterium]|nr:hypothetical protein [Pseudomonadota bacterium]